MAHRVQLNGVKPNSVRLAGAVALAAGLLGGGANAQGKLDAYYVVTLAGVPIGKGGWVIEVGDDQFIAAANGMTTGLLRVFATGDGKGASRGTIRGDNLAPTLFVSTINNDKRVEELKIVMSAGNIKELMVEPPTTPNPDRIPLTDAHRRGIVDPLSASLIRVPGNGDPVAPEACRRTLPVFDGRMRFDLQLSFKRIEKVEVKGYQGPVMVCAVYFTPVSGYLPNSTTMKYLASIRDAEAWMAPIAGTRVLVPFRFSLPTPVGVGTLEATQFVTVAKPPQAAANTKLQ